MKNKIYINLSGLDFSSLHPILKNLYKKLEKYYEVKYINGKIQENLKEVPKIVKYRGLKKIKYKLFEFMNSFVPRCNIIKTKYDGKLLTANNFLITENDYFIVTSSLIQFGGLKIRPLYNPIFKYFFKKFLLQPNLKKIYFYSKTAYKEFDRYCQDIVRLKKDSYINKIDVYYPELIDNKVVSIEDIEKRIEKIKKIKFLFVARFFLAKGGYELIKALKVILNKYPEYIGKFEVNIISDISEKFRIELERLKNKGIDIKMYGIQFTQEELEEYFYRTTHVLLHLTRADLFGMVSLESKKNGLAVITTNQYLNPELFKENEALFVKIKDKYVWNDGLPRIDYKTIWNLEEEVLNVNDIVENMIKLIKNKNLLKQLAINNRNSLTRFKNKGVLEFTN